MAATVHRHADSPTGAATIEDLYKVPGKAELVGGRIVEMAAAGFLPHRVSMRIWRSLDDYGPAADRELRDKRAHYFVAGSLVIRDVDPLEEETILVFRDGDPDSPAAIYRRGEIADAEPAVPGWRVQVDDLFK